MRPLVTAAVLGLALAIAGCSKPTQEKTTQDIKAVGSEVKDAAKQVAGTPAAKELGSDIKQGTQEAAQKTKEAASDAGDKLKEGASKAGDQLKEGADKAGAKTDQALNNAKDKSDKH